MKFQTNWVLPYTKDIMALLPNYCHNDQDIWLMVDPLICFYIIEWLQLDRILRQFGLQQTILSLCFTIMQLHQIHLQGKHDQDWHRLHANYTSLWRAHCDHCA